MDFHVFCSMGEARWAKIIVQIGQHSTDFDLYRTRHLLVDQAGNS